MTTLAPPLDSAPPLGGHSERASGTKARGRWWLVAELVVLALLAYLPLLAARPGVATPDTKTYLYLNPSKFLSQVGSMWDPTVAMGTVTHQYIGYLLPMGPFFLLFHVLGVHLWVVQRLWLGTIMFAAGAGVLYLAKTLSLKGPGRLVAALAFMMSPYVLQYSGRISVLLLPWAGLPWLVAFAALTLRRGGWRYPALFAIVVALVSSINATSIIYVGLAPILWILYAIVVEREATWRTGLLGALKIGFLSILVCLWWAIGLLVEAGYGVDVLKYTETVVTTSAGSSASEVIRGLGYWYFYGTDRLGAWTSSGVLYTQRLSVLEISYAVPLLAFVAAAIHRWRVRAYFVLLVVVGMVLSVGPHPYDSPTAFGGILKAFMTQTTAGLALRSTDRATPLVVLGMAMLLGAGVTALWSRAPRTGIAVGAGAIVLVVVNNPALFNGDTIANNFTQPARLPAAQMAAIHYLNSMETTLRVLGIPGNDFASYRWGNTVDSPQPAFLNRPWITHEQQVMGSTATADILYAFDDPIQEGTAVPSALAPMARLMSASNLMVDYDTQYEHYGQPHPATLHALLTPTPSGLTNPKSFGAPFLNKSVYPTLDEEDLVNPNATVPLSPVVVYDVPGARPITRAESDQGALVVSGSGTGLQNMAGLGLLNTNSAIYYSGTLANHEARIHQLMSGGAQLVVTDTNRKQGFRWDTISASTGATETATQDAQRGDPTDNPISLFPQAGRDAKTIATFQGAASVTASAYGTPFSYLPEDRPFNAIDNNLDTAWRTGIFSEPMGQWWQVHFATPATASQITLTQPQNGDLARWLTEVRLTFDGTHSVTVHLSPASRTSAGQVVSFPSRAFSTLRITILHTSNDHASPAAATAVGLAEVAIPGRSVQEVLEMPTDLTKAAGTASINNRLTYVMNRWRSSPFPPRFDPETTIARSFDVPTPRSFAVSGTASLSTLIPDDQVDRLVGSTPGRSGVPVAYSSGRILGGLVNRASATIDNDVNTFWQPGFGKDAQVGSWLRYDTARPLTFSSMNLAVITDGRHSVPKVITISTPSGSRTVTLPHLKVTAGANSVTTVPLSFAPLTGQQITVTFDKVVARNTVNYNAPLPLAEPIAIAEVGIPGLSTPPPPATLPSACLGNLLQIDGKPVWISITGTTAQAVTNQTVSFTACGPSAGGIALSAGSHEIETAQGHTVLTGWNLDGVTLDSLAGGAPAPLPVNGTLEAVQPGPAPSAVVTAAGTTSERVTLHQVGGAFELVLGQSSNAGWQAIALPPRSGAGHSVDLGAPQLVDGFANGWHVSASDLTALGITSSQLRSGDTSFVVALNWTPQSSVWLALWISGLALVGCLVLALGPMIFRRRRSTVLDAEQSDGEGALAATKVDTPDAPPAARTRAEIMAARRTESRQMVVSADEEGSNPLDALLTWPFARAGDRPRWWVIALSALIAGGITSATVNLWAGLGVVVVVVVGCLVDRTRGIASVGAVGLLLTAALLVIGAQAAHHYLEGEWPVHFNTAGSLTLAAVSLLGADALVATVRWSATRRKERNADTDSGDGA